ncbi:MAG: hypothetical protein ACXAC7_04425 [Candidatus Hodarchaeales archaeon]|jgi:hypothetical protein
MKRWKEIKDKAQTFADDIKENLSQEEETTKTDKKQTKQPFYERKTTTPEEYLGTIWGWFWALWFGFFIALIGIVLAFSNPKFWLFAILLAIALPFWVIYCILMMIPEVKIFGFTVFNRRNLSVRQSLTVGSRLTYFLSKEFIRSSPEIAILIFGFIGVLFFSIIIAVM